MKPGKVEMQMQGVTSGMSSSRSSRDAKHRPSVSLSSVAVDGKSAAAAAVILNSKSKSKSMDAIEEFLMETVLESTNSLGMGLPASPRRTSSKWSQDDFSGEMLWSGLLRVFVSELWLQELRDQKSPQKSKVLPKNFFHRLFNPSDPAQQADGKWKSGYAEMSRTTLQIIVAPHEYTDADGNVSNPLSFVGSSSTPEPGDRRTSGGDMGGQNLEILIPLEKLVLYEPDTVPDFDRHIDGFGFGVGFEPRTSLADCCDPLATDLFSKEKPQRPKVEHHNIHIPCLHIRKSDAHTAPPQPPPPCCILLKRISPSQPSQPHSHSHRHLAEDVSFGLSRENVCAIGAVGGGERD
jgi:hypothetical protein